MSTVDKEVVEGKDDDEVVVVVEEGKTPPSFLGMSDAEMMAAPPPDFSAVKLAPAAADVVKEEKKEPAEEADPEGGDKPTESAADDADGKKEEKQVEAKVDDKTKVKEASKEKVEAKVDTDTTTPKDDKSKEEVAAVVDFEAEYRRLLAPFKANGRDIAVASVDDAISLMQMGANYNKKMAALKPNLKLMKMLENNGFMSEEKIGFLIDLGKKDPAAINKLVKDSGIDPMDLDAEKASAYKQTAYAVDDREIELDTVLDELQGSPTYTRTLDVVSNKWDVASKQVVSQSPQLLRVINDHVASGIYDLISTEVERERVFGRLKGVSDIEAYKQIGDAIQARGGFNHIGKPKVEEKPAAPVIVTPKPKVEDDKLKDKRRAASATQPAASTATPKDFNPLALSDEDFSKLGNPKFL